MHKELIPKSEIIFKTKNIGKKHAKPVFNDILNEIIKAQVFLFQDITRHCKFVTYNMFTEKRENVVGIHNWRGCDSSVTVSFEDLAGEKFSDAWFFIFLEFGRRRWSTIKIWIEKFRKIEFFILCQKIEKCDHFEFFIVVFCLDKKILLKRISR